MSKSLISETYVRRLKEDAKSLNLDPSVCQKKFAQWDIERFRGSTNTNILKCKNFKRTDIPYIFSYLKSLPVITQLGIEDTEVNSTLLSAIIFVLQKTRTLGLILATCVIDDGVISHFLREYTLLELKIIRCQMGPQDTISLLNNSVLKTLELRVCTLMGKNLSALSSNSTITSLTLFHCRIDSKDVGFLSENRVLKTLDLEDNPEIGNEGVRVLSRHPTITSLSLNQCKISPQGAYFLSKNRVLKTLILNCNDANPPIGDEGAIALSSHPTVTSLDLNYCKIGPKGLDSFSKNRVLKELNLGSNPDIGKEISASWVNTTITSLDLSGSEIGPAEAAYFLNCPVLETLELFENPLGDEGADLLSRIPTLTALGLGRCQINSKGAIYFLNSNQLKSLTLQYNPIRDEGAESLSTHPALTRLNLSECQLSDGGAIALARNSRLTELDLQSNNIVYWGESHWLLTSQYRNWIFPVAKLSIQRCGFSWVIRL